jgi:hypothetical protein
VHRSVSSSGRRTHTEGDDDGKARMDLTAFVGKLLEEQYCDVLREEVRVLSQALMEAEVAGCTECRRGKSTT